MAQWVRKSPVMQETQEMGVRSLGWEDPLEKEMASLQCSCLENPMDRGAWRAPVLGVSESQTQSSDWHLCFYFLLTACSEPVLADLWEQTGSSTLSFQIWCLKGVLSKAVKKEFSGQKSGQADPRGVGPVMVLGKPRAVHCSRWGRGGGSWMQRVDLGRTVPLLSCHICHVLCQVSKWSLCCRKWTSEGSWSI